MSMKDEADIEWSYLYRNAKDLPHHEGDKADAHVNVRAANYSALPPLACAFRRSDYHVASQSAPPQRPTRHGW